MDKKKPVAALLLLTALGSGAWWLLQDRAAAVTEPTAWGHVDTRSVSLAFEASGRIAELGPEEGMRVKKGDTLGRLDTRTAELERKRLLANAEALRAQWELAVEGARKEDIRAAEAELSALREQRRLAGITAKRQAELFRSRATTEQARDDAQYTLAQLTAQEKSLEAQLLKLRNGSRPQEIESARAQLAAAEAAVAQIDHQIRVQSVLTAPADGIVRVRAAEPGDMASAARTVYELSLDNPKWVRAYLTEARLGEVKEGDVVTVETDTTPPMPGRIAFISDTAEFTPKTVQTEDLRTALVYEFRVDVDDPEHVLRMGQPVTVRLRPPSTQPGAEGS